MPRLPFCCLRAPKPDTPQRPVTHAYTHTHAHTHISCAHFVSYVIYLSMHKFRAHKNRAAGFKNLCQTRSSLLMLNCKNWHQTKDSLPKTLTLEGLASARPTRSRFSKATVTLKAKIFDFRPMAASHKAPHGKIVLEGKVHPSKNKKICHFLLILLLYSVTAL